MSAAQRQPPLCLAYFKVYIYSTFETLRSKASCRGCARRLKP